MQSLATATYAGVDGIDGVKTKCMLDGNKQAHVSKQYTIMFSVSCTWSEQIVRGLDQLINPNSLT